MVDRPKALVHETTSTTGTGNLTVSSVNGKQTFNDAHGTGGTDKFRYYISNRDAAEWEYGTGHLLNSTTLVRDTVITSSNADAAVTFSAGTKDVTNDIGASTAIEGSVGTDNSIPRVDGTTNHLLQSSGVTIDDSNNMDTGTGNVTSGGIFKVDVDGTAINAAGSVTLGAGNDAGHYWDGTNWTFNVLTGGYVFELAGADSFIFQSGAFRSGATAQALGTTSNPWADLFLETGGVINWNSGDVTVTHSANALAFAGASSGYTFDAGVNPASDDGAPLGTTSLKWSDLFLASGAVLNFNSGNVTVTHSAGLLTINNSVNLSTGTLQEGGVDISPIGQQTIVVPAKAWTAEDGAAGPTLSTYTGTNLDIPELLFDGASTETAFFTFQAPKGSDEAASLVIEISYQPKGTSSGNVRWSVAAVAVGDADTTDATLGTAAANDSAAGAVANVTQKSGEMTITVGGTWAAEDDIHVKLQRLGGHANDTNTDDVGLINARIHYSLAAATDD